MSKPIHRVMMPTHHEAIRDMKDGDRIHVVMRKAPENPPLPEMKPSMANRPEEKVMPLETPFHVESIARMPAGEGDSVARRGKKTNQDPMKFLKDKQSEEMSEVS